MNAGNKYVSLSHKCEIMAFKYHKPTRDKCEVCEELDRTATEKPIIRTYDGKASSANNHPFHNWYNFVLGYTPDFPLYIINKYNITSEHTILDPFMGTATTNVVAKEFCIPSFGVEANDYFIKVGKTKLTWNVDIEKVNRYFEEIRTRIYQIANKYQFEDLDNNLFSKNNTLKPYTEFNTLRPEGLGTRYISDKPFAKLMIIKQAINEVLNRNIQSEIDNFFHTAFTSIIVPSSNVSYGPGFGIKKARNDYDVFGIFERKVTRMLGDLNSVKDNKNRATPFKIIHGDSRKLSTLLEASSIDYIITSPPYPGDHEYTKYTKLELMIEHNIISKEDFRVIKKRMLVGSTTNIYKECNDRVAVTGNPLIVQITDEIQRRLDYDGATSGYEKLYTKLIWEYFGGMAIVLSEALKVLKKGGKFSLLVSDSHAFKMVHIQTALILKDIALSLGYSDGLIELWQHKRSTSHRYNLREEILTLTK